MNIIWNAAGDYSFIPNDLLYDETGKAQLFGNYILGAVRRYYDINLLNEFFNELNEDSDADFLKELTWLALENVVYQQGIAERLVLTELRQNYARDYIETHEITQDSDFLVDLKVVHYQLILGNNPPMSETIRDVLQALAFDQSLSTGQILEKMRAVIEQYFQYNPAKYENNWISGLQKTKTNFRIASKKKRRSFRFPFMKKLQRDALDIPEAANSSVVQVTKNFMSSYWRRYRNQKQQDQQNFIRNYYGESLISDSRLKTLESLICTGSHKKIISILRGDWSPIPAT